MMGKGRSTKVDGRRWELVLEAEYPGRLWCFRGLRIHGGLQGLGIRLSLGNLRKDLRIRRVAQMGRPAGLGVLAGLRRLACLGRAREELWATLVPRHSVQRERRFHRQS